MDNLKLKFKYRRNNHGIYYLFYGILYKKKNDTKWEKADFPHKKTSTSKQDIIIDDIVWN